MGKLVDQMAAIVDSQLPANTYLGGEIVFQESIEDPDDWEIVVVTRVECSREQRFDLSLRIGETLNQVIETAFPDPNWTGVAFRLDLSSRNASARVHSNL